MSAHRHLLLNILAHLFGKVPTRLTAPLNVIFPSSLSFFIQRSIVFEGIFVETAISTTRLPGFFANEFQTIFVPSLAPSFVPSLIPPFYSSLAGRRENLTTKRLSFLSTLAGIAIYGAPFHHTLKPVPSLQ